MRRIHVSRTSLSTHAPSTSLLRRALPLLPLVVGGVAAAIALLVCAELALRALNIGSTARVFAAAQDDDGTPIMRLAWNPSSATPCRWNRSGSSPR